MKNNNPLYSLAIIVIFILVILNIVMAIKTSEYSTDLISLRTVNTTKLIFEGKIKTEEECPDAIGGNEDSFLQIKYFYSKFCPWCIKEEPILQKLAKDYGNLINIKWHNVNDCQELVNKYKVSGVPTFIFNTINNQTEYSHYGFIPEKDLIKLMCDVTGECE